MIPIQSSPLLLLVCLATSILLGLVVTTWGKRLPNSGSWFVWAAMVVLVADVVYNGSVLSQTGYKAVVWLRGWIGPKEESGAILVGAAIDMLGLILSSLAIALASVLLLSSGFLAKEPRPDRVYSAIAVSTAGVILSWVSMTPWLAFLGLVFTVFGGFLALGSRWDEDSESLLAARFAWERCWGIVLAIVGTCVLAGSRAALDWSSSASWSGGDTVSWLDWAGACILGVSLFIQVQSFPFAGWAMFKSDGNLPSRVLLNQIFPAWSAFAFLIRIEPQLRSLHFFPAFGWVALASSVLTVFSGLFHEEPRPRLGAWVSASLSLVVAVLAFTGVWSALTMLIGISIGAFAMACSAASLQEESGNSASARQRGMWSKIVCFAAVAAATGVIGFVTAGGGLRWIVQVADDPVRASAFALVLFLNVWLGWRVAMVSARASAASSASWVFTLAPLLLVIAALGLFWTGSVSGGAIPGDSDRAMASLLGLFLEEPKLAPEAYNAGAWFYWGAVAFGLAIALWTSGRQDRWQQVQKAMPKTATFVSEGYGISGLFGHLLAAIIWVGRGMVKVFDERVWNRWVPAGLSVGIRRGSNVISSVDPKISAALGHGLRRGIDLPAKLLQLIQSGDVQWYLLFAIGVGIAMLVHFLRG